MSTPLTPAVPPTPPVSPPRRRRTTLYLVVAAVAVVVVLLVAFVALPALTTSSGSGGGPAILTYDGAAPIANRTAAGYSGGGWTLLFAAGLVSASNESFPANPTALGNLSSECTVTVVTDTSTLTLPGFLGNRSSGQSPAWEFGYRNSSDTLAIVSVISGHGMVLATLSGFVCAFSAQLVSPIPGNVIDSSQAALAVRSQAAGFLAQHPNASAELGLIGAIASRGHPSPEWSITYSTCALSPSATGTGDQFNATVNALTGSVLSTNTRTGVSCGSGTTTTAILPPGPHALPPTADRAARARSHAAV